MTAATRILTMLATPTCTVLPRRYHPPVDLPTPLRPEQASSRCHCYALVAHTMWSATASRRCCGTECYGASVHHASMAPIRLSWLAGTHLTGRQNAEADCIQETAVRICCLHGHATSMPRRFRQLQQERQSLWASTTYCVAVIMECCKMQLTTAGCYRQPFSEMLTPQQPGERHDMWAYRVAIAAAYAVGSAAACIFLCVPPHLY